MSNESISEEDCINGGDCALHGGWTGAGWDGKKSHRLEIRSRDLIITSGPTVQPGMKHLALEGSGHVALRPAIL